VNLPVVTRCGLNMPSPDLLTPARAAAHVWTWAPGHPRHVSVQGWKPWWLPRKINALWDALLGAPEEVCCSGPHTLRSCSCLANVDGVYSQSAWKGLVPRIIAELVQALPQVRWPVAVLVKISCSVCNIYVFRLHGPRTWVVLYHVLHARAQTYKHDCSVLPAPPLKQVLVPYICPLHYQSPHLPSNFVGSQSVHLLLCKGKIRVLLQLPLTLLLASTYLSMSIGPLSRAQVSG
jgi:hypothetical protein